MGLETIALAAITATTTAISVSQARKSAKAQKKANAIQTGKEKFQQSEDVRKRIRARRIAEANLINSSEAGGTQGSSGEVGGIGSLSSQVSNSVANQSFESRTNDALSRQGQIAANANLKAQTVNSVGDLFKTTIKDGNLFE